MHECFIMHDVWNSLHDYIFQEDSFHVHIYVKGVNKDNVRVVFEKKTFSVKFQTGSVGFILL